VFVGLLVPFSFQLDHPSWDDDFLSSIEIVSGKVNSVFSLYTNLFSSW
jgi:hypothetical protein